MSKTKEQTTGKTEPAKAEQKAPKRGVGTVAKEAIKAGKTNEEALAIVQKEFPDCKASMSSIAWYRNSLRQAGEKVPTSRELAAARKPAAEKADDKGKGKGKGKADPLA